VFHVCMYVCACMYVFEHVCVCVCVCVCVYVYVCVCMLPGTMSIYCGTGVAGYQDGGCGTARFDGPRGIALLAGVVYIADSGNSILRAINVNTSARPCIPLLREGIHWGFVLANFRVCVCVFVLLCVCVCVCDVCVCASVCG
jgi:hypothetical protein